MVTRRRVTPDKKVRIAKTADALKVPAGRYSTDTKGLCLVVTRTGESRRWLYRFQAARGERQEVTIGTTVSHTLEEATAKATAYIAKIEVPKPAMLKKAPKPKPIHQVAGTIASGSRTFGVIAEEVLAHKKTIGQKPKTLSGRRQRLDKYILPVLKNRMPLEIQVDEVVAVLRPIWTTLGEQSERVRREIEEVIQEAIEEADDAARASGIVIPVPSNPASKQRLLRKQKLIAHAMPRGRQIDAKAKSEGRRGGHKSSSLSDVGAVLLHSKFHHSNGGNAARFLIYTSSRPGMVRHLLWEELDLRKDPVWLCPGSKMKSKRDFRLPLSTGAMEVLRSMGIQKEGTVFKGQRGGVLSDNTINKWIKGAAIEAKTTWFTGHGGRTTFTTWRKANFLPPELCELCLDHYSKDMSDHYTETDAPELDEAKLDVMQKWSDALDLATAEAALR